jgi:arylsulfatase A-like enzyme
VVITADHGELLGEHGLTGHAQSLYEEGLHVPLIIRYPSAAPSGVRIAREVSLRDLAATIQSLAGVPGSFPGTSLSRLWQDSSARTSPALAEVRQQPNPLGDYPTAKGALKALVSDGWFYVVNEGTKGEELYHVGGGADPSVDHARGDSAAVLLPPWRARLADAVAKR